MAVSPADPALACACERVDAARRAPGTLRAQVKAFFDEPTSTISYVIRDPQGSACAIVDSVLAFDPASGRTSTRSLDGMVDYLKSGNLRVQWLLETHAHADHLSAAPWLRERFGGQLAIGCEIVRVQEMFGKVFNAGDEFARDGSQFDHLFHDGEPFQIGALQAMALHVPGHTPACVAYVIGEAIFPGDTLFMPDFGTARCDFPGGDARQLYRSIHRLLALPGDARLFLCHDYKAAGRDHYAWETTIEAERARNIHVHESIGEDEFVATRRLRDATLSMPDLLLPSVQVNMRGGRLPPPEDNGVSYLKIPVNVL